MVKTSSGDNVLKLWMPLDAKDASHGRLHHLFDFAYIAVEDHQTAVEEADGKQVWLVRTKGKATAATLSLDLSKICEFDLIRLIS